MEVKINIEAGQIGDTVIDLFKNLKEEDKRSLALEVLKEWLISPEFLEVENKKQILISEFREGKRNLYYSSQKVSDLSDEQLIRDSSFQKALLEYKNSKQIMVEEIKTEVINYYKEFIKNELQTNEKVEKIKNDTFDEVKTLFPKIIYDVLVQNFSNMLSNQSYKIQELCYGYNGLNSILDNKLQSINND